MKYLVLLLIILAGIWWIRQQRKPDDLSSNKKSGTQVMVTCAHCGTHVPEDDAIRGSHGFYCSAAHRDSHEG